MPDGIAFKLSRSFSDNSLPIIHHPLSPSGIRSRFVAGSQITTFPDGRSIKTWDSSQGDSFSLVSGRNAPLTSAVSGGGKTIDAVFFGGTTQAIRSPLPATRPHTVAFLAYLTQLPSEQRFFIGGSGANIGINQYGFIASSGTAGVFGNKPVTPGWNVGVVSFASGDTVGRFNGATTTRTLGSNNRSELTVGIGNSDDSSTQVGIHMYLRELVTWDRALTTGELVAVESELRASVS